MQKVAQMVYIATFYSHFGAIRFKRERKDILTPQLMPVPRELSSSCGTCVRFLAENFTPPADPDGEIEQIVRETDGGYICIYRAQNS